MTDSLREPAPTPGAPTPRAPRLRPPARPAALRRAVVAAAALLLLAAPAPRAARGEKDDAAHSSVAAVNGVVVHGVDTKTLAARVREIDQRLADGTEDAAAKGLADLTQSDLGALLEEGQGIYLAAQESVLQRVATLGPPALAKYRDAVDPRGATALADAVRTRDANALGRDAARFAFTTDGPRLLLLLADLRTAQGDASGAERALEDLLRLLPGHVPAATLAAAASRLAGLIASRGDVAGVHGLADDLPADVLDAPSALLPGKTLRFELAAAADLAARRAETTSAGPAGPMRVVAESMLVSGRQEDRMGLDGRDPGALREHPLPVGDASRPAVLVRRRRPRTDAWEVVALAAPVADPDLPPRVAPPLTELWRWPSSVSEDPFPAPSQPFAPARLTDDLVVLTWPAPPAENPRVTRFSDGPDERHELVVLSLSAEGKLVEERGLYEIRRDAYDMDLESLSFCGRPCVDGRAVYVSAVRHSAEGDTTELHVCRFDFVPEGRGGKLVLRWRQHVLDGRPPSRADYEATDRRESPSRLALPTAPLVAAGRVFVGSNSGAVACIDAASGRPEWVETYERAGPPDRLVALATELATWDDVPLSEDGPFVFAAPRDAETLLQFRRAPRGARSTRVETFPFSAPSGTARDAGRIFFDFVPTQAPGVLDGVVYLAGRVPTSPRSAEAADASPLAAFELRTRRGLLAQVQEYAPAGAACLVRGALLLPTPKAIYRVPLDAFEGPPQVLWEAPGAGDPFRSADRIGNLVPDGDHLWDVTTTRILLLGPAR